MTLRPYQEEAQNAVLDAWSTGNRKVLIVLGTGCGKTIIFSHIAKKLVESGERVLILAHRGELLSQASEKLKSATGLDSCLEKASSSCLDKTEPVVVGSVQTLGKNSRLERFPEDYFGTIIVDEAHHIMAETYQRVLKHFSKAKVLGVTATPNRSDMKNLGDFFDCLAYEYNMVDAIRDGYLSPISVQVIPLEVDISGVATAAGDYVSSALSSAIEPYLEAIADKMVEYCQGRKVMVFTPLIKTSEKMTDILNRKGFKACEVNGNSEDREEKISGFSKGKYNVIVSSLLLTEGYDEPSVDCIVCLRPTQSKSLFCQIVGRGSRLYEGKENLLLLDFLWLTGKHDLCHPSSLVASDDVTAARMNEIAAASGFTKDLFALETEAVNAINTDREAALAKRLRELQRQRSALVDPMQFFASIGEIHFGEREELFGWEKEIPTDEQLSFISKCGINPDAIRTRGEATRIIERLMRRIRLGYSTPKQIRFLERRGFQHVGKWKKTEAGEMIDAIAKNDWKIPRGLRPEKYQPERLSNIARENRRAK